MSQPKKVVLLGHFGVGKTSLLRRFVDDAFSEDYIVTLGVQVKKKNVKINGNPVSLIIWDIEGNQFIDKVRSSYLLGTHGFIYVFDVCRPETYENLGKEMEYLSNNFTQTPVSLVGNKADLFTETFSKNFFKEDYFKECFYTSAKTGNNVEAMFAEIATKML